MGMFWLFVGIALIMWVGHVIDMQSKREKRLLLEAKARAEGLPALASADTPQALPAPPQAELLPLPEPQRSQAFALLCRIHDFDMDSLDPRSRYLLEQTAVDYLPATVRAFTELSPAAAARLRNQGMPPETLLAEQIGLLQEGVREALGSDHATADRLLVQGRFLRERFEKEKLRV